MTDPTLFDTPDEHARFDRRNPGIWAAFCKAVDDARAAGIERYSAYTIRERVRWHFQVERGQRDWKCNNNWTPYLARRWRDAHPEAPGFFEFRASKHDQEAA